MGELYKKNTMKTKNKIDIIRKKDELIDDYLNEIPAQLLADLYTYWNKKAKEISEFLENDIINALYLAAIVDILFRKRKESRALLNHSKSTRKDYIGANDLSLFIKKYRKQDAIPLRIVIDYKTIYKKGDTSIPREDDDYDTMSSTTVTISGEKLLKLLIDPCLKGSLQELTQVFGTYERQPLFEPKTLPNTKAKFIAKHNKTAISKIDSFFALYPKLKEKQKKIFTMKMLVFIGFLDSYQKYKSNAKEKKLKKVLAENEYYLQRYTDLTTVKKHNAKRKITE